MSNKAILVLEVSATSSTTPRWLVDKELFLATPSERDYPWWTRTAIGDQEVVFG